MQNPVLFPPFGASETDPSSNFNIVIAYEDFETGKQAKRIYDSLVEGLGQRWHFENQMWKFDVLSIPKLREMATNDAASADLIIISCHGNELPSGVRAWFEEWLGSSSRPAALVALVDSGSSKEADRTRAVRAELAAIARRGQMEFFSPNDDSFVDRKARHDTKLDERDSELRTSIAVAGALLREPDASAWGCEEAPRFE